MSRIAAVLESNSHLGLFYANSDKKVNDYKLF